MFSELKRHPTAYTKACHYRPLEVVVTIKHILQESGEDDVKELEPRYKFNGGKGKKIK